MAACLLSSVWILSLIICSPPWFVPGWGLFADHQRGMTDNTSASSSRDDSFMCGYSPSVPYRIYSALGSFYIPLLVMLSVYFKIFRVASEREALMRQSIGTYRLSNRIVKSNNRNNLRTASAPHSRTKQIPKRKSTEVNSDVPVMTRRAQAVHARLQPNNLLAKAYEHYQINGPGKAVRGSKEKMVYLRERKALKTIGIVVMGFIICWMPFFVMYLIEVFATSVSNSRAFKLIGEFFLWLGYSNSVSFLSYFFQDLFNYN
ncbi:7 transmembrane receptor [Oesophagostomum dentatum]|uniref:7 transmembrane receptor n=1 Tax=Oesophagostomum dentatum TaxID=61180 RepID=A0A0B1T5V7_OESDE|nr:7 transmembrane receptor [Oesophagostomum dentatum]